MSTFRYERRPPVTSCTRCGTALWPEGIARVLVSDKPDSLGRERERLIKECFSCAPSGPSPSWAGPSYPSAEANR